MLTSEETIGKVRELTDTVILKFSGGKDSIAAWIAIRDKFPRIIPFFMYLIPDLEINEITLRYWEEKMGMRILRYPMPSLVRMLNNFVFQHPENIEIIQNARLKWRQHEELNEIVRKEHDARDAYVATGVRAVDSPMRWMAIKKWGAMSTRTKTFQPVFDWNKERLINVFKSEGIVLGPEYRIYKQSFDGLDARFLVPLKKHFPQDYAKVLEWFPFAEAETFRYENQQRRGLVKKIEKFEDDLSPTRK